MSAGVNPVSRVDEVRESDARLVQRCLEGDDSAWADLIAKYKNLIFSIPVRYGFSQEDSADIFQQVCMDLLSGLQGLREPDALPAWLIQVTRNRCFRKKREHLHQNIETIDEATLPQSQELDENVIAKAEEDQRLREVLRELSPRCRDLVNMLFFEVPPKPYEEIAKKLGLAVGSVGLTRRRCLDKLQQKLVAMGV